MPEEYEFEKTEVPNVVRPFEDWLNGLSTSDEGLTVGEFDAMFQVLYFRLRSIYTVEQMHVRLHALMAQGEHMLHEPGFLFNEDGDPSTPILRENFADTPDEVYHKMLADQFNEATDEELEELLDGKDKT